MKRKSQKSQKSKKKKSRIRITNKIDNGYLWDSKEEIQAKKNQKRDNDKIDIEIEKLSCSDHNGGSHKTQGKPGECFKKGFATSFLWDSTSKKINNNDLNFEEMQLYNEFREKNKDKLSTEEINKIMRTYKVNKNFPIKFPQHIALQIMGAIAENMKKNRERNTKKS